MTKNEIDERIEDHNRRAMHGDFSYEEKFRLKTLLDNDEDILALARQRKEIDGAMKVHDRAKWIVRSIAVGAPILVALWQLFDRLRIR